MSTYEIHQAILNSRYEEPPRHWYIAEYQPAEERAGVDYAPCQNQPRPNCWEDSAVAGLDDNLVRLRERAVWHCFRHTDTGDAADDVRSCRPL